MEWLNYFPDSLDGSALVGLYWGEVSWFSEQLILTYSALVLLNSSLAALKGSSNGDSLRLVDFLKAKILFLILLVLLRFYFLNYLESF